MFSDDLGRKGLSKKTKDNIFLSSHKTILYSFILFLVFFSFNTDADAADRYWVGSAGGWRIANS